MTKYSQHANRTFTVLLILIIFIVLCTIKYKLFSNYTTEIPTFKLYKLYIIVFK